MTFSMFQEKFNQLGAVSRTYRKRIQDVFDIESLGPKQEDENMDERVFVLPRAPNASVQRYPTRSQSPKESHDSGHAEMGEIDQFGTVHRMFPHQQNRAV